MVLDTIDRTSGKRSTSRQMARNRAKRCKSLNLNAPPWCGAQVKGVWHCLSDARSRVHVGDADMQAVGSLQVLGNQGLLASPKILATITLEDKGLTHVGLCLKGY